MYGLIPIPQSIKTGGSSCPLGSILRIACRGENLADQARLLSAWLAKKIQALPVAISPVKAGGPLDEGGVNEISLRLDPSITGTEAYRLEIKPDGISITASDAPGIVRAAATLCQLALSEGPVLPTMVIEDAPRFGWRGFMLDCARNFFSVEFIEKAIDLAAMHKLNVFHWHLTDDQAWRLDLDSMPELARHGSRRQDRRIAAVRWKEGSYSEADVRRVVEFARVRHVRVLPEIETPGHCVALLASHPELSCRAPYDDRAFLPEDRYGVFEDVMCAGNETTHELLQRILEGASRLFDAPFVHLGGDEVLKSHWRDCPECRKAMREHNLRDSSGSLDPEKLEAWFMQKMAEKLKVLGKRMIGWDELADYGVPLETIIMAWRGFDTGIRAAKAGYDVVMCPQTKACYLDHKHLDSIEEPGQLGVCTVRDSYAFEPMPDGLTPEEQKKILGGQANLWSEQCYFSREAEYMLYPRLCAIAEALWSSKQKRNFEDFAKRMETHGKRLDSLDVQRYRGPLF